MRLHYTRPLDRLIYARCLVMDRDGALGDLLCRFVFEEDRLDRVATLSRSRSKIMFNAAWVRSSDQATLVTYLTGLAQRAK